VGTRSSSLRLYVPVSNSSLLPLLDTHGVSLYCPSSRFSLSRVFPFLVSSPFSCLPLSRVFPFLVSSPFSCLPLSRVFPFLRFGLPQIFAFLQQMPPFSDIPPPFHHQKPMIELGLDPGKIPTLLESSCFKRHFPLPRKCMIRYKLVSCSLSFSLQCYVY
jgi:hypothetical protein